MAFIIALRPRLGLTTLGISEVKVTGWENRMERKARTGCTIFRDLAFCNLGLIKETQP